MGYANVWLINPDRVPADALARTIMDTKLIIDFAAERGVKICDWDGRPPGHPDHEEPLSEFGIRLNGWDERHGAPSDGAHATFSLDLDAIKAGPGDVRPHLWVAEHNSTYNFAKTNRKPYDAVVQAILLRAYVHFDGAVQLLSDGDWHFEWLHGGDYWRGGHGRFTAGEIGGGRMIVAELFGWTDPDNILLEDC